jgi:hypothetical protein
VHRFEEAGEARVPAKGGERRHAISTPPMRRELRKFPVGIFQWFDGIWVFESPRAEIGCIRALTPAAKRSRWRGVW